jgi:hypothetical protein
VCVSIVIVVLTSSAPMNWSNLYTLANFARLASNKQQKR